MSYAADVRRMSSREQAELVQCLLAIMIHRHGPLKVTRAEIAIELMGSAGQSPIMVYDLPDGDFEIRAMKQ